MVRQATLLLGATAVLLAATALFSASHRVHGTTAVAPAPLQHAGPLPGLLTPEPLESDQLHAATPAPTRRVPSDRTDAASDTSQPAEDTSDDGGGGGGAAYSVCEGAASADDTPPTRLDDPPFLTVAMPHPRHQALARHLACVLSPRTRGRATFDADRAVPLLGYLVVAADADEWFDTTAFAVDAHVYRLVVVLNADDAALAQRFRTLERALRAASCDFTFVHCPDNCGVAGGWNRVLSVAFALPRPALPPPWSAAEKVRRGGSAEVDPVVDPTAARPTEWALICNADVSFRRGVLAAFALATFHLRHPWRGGDAAGGSLANTTLAVHHLLEWAAFAVTLDAVAAVGGFDEAMWPAYGEDTEYAVRLATFRWPPPGRTVSP